MLLLWQVSTWQCSSVLVMRYWAVMMSTCLLCFVCAVRLRRHSRESWHSVRKATFIPLAFTSRWHRDIEVFVKMRLCFLNYKSEPGLSQNDSNAIVAVIEQRSQIRKLLCQFHAFQLLMWHLKSQLFVAKIHPLLMLISLAQASVCVWLCADNNFNLHGFDPDVWHAASPLYKVGRDRR